MYTTKSSGLNADPFGTPLQTSVYDRSRPFAFCYLNGSGTILADHLPHHMLLTYEQAVCDTRYKIESLSKIQKDLIDVLTVSKSPKFQVSSSKFIEEELFHTASNICLKIE